MNIYLTSYGLDTRYKDYMNSYEDILHILKNKNVAIIPNAKLIVGIVKFFCCSRGIEEKQYQL